jgi:hypothetical protein
MRTRAPCTARRRRERGIALADFITGTIILAGAVTAWVSITRAQFDATSFAGGREQARNAALEALEVARPTVGAACTSLSGEADKEGFRVVQTFAVTNLPAPGPGKPSGVIEARPLVVDGRPSPGVFEVRATVTWRAAHGVEHVEVSTAVAGVRVW